MAVVTRELAQIEKMFKDFQSEHEADGMPVFTKKLDFYLEALKFNSDKVMGGLDDEISASMREIEEKQKLNHEKI